VRELWIINMAKETEMLGDNLTIVCTECNAQFLFEQAENENWEYCPCCGETYL
jgi:PHP family Zn ribbon phosphoesterase